MKLLLAAILAVAAWGGYHKKLNMPNGGVGRTAIELVASFVLSYVVIKLVFAIIAGSIVLIFKAIKWLIIVSIILAVVKFISKKTR